jgi:hypothetical protein
MLGHSGMKHLSLSPLSPWRPAGPPPAGEHCLSLSPPYPPGGRRAPTRRGALPVLIPCPYPWEHCLSLSLLPVLIPPAGEHCLSLSLGALPVLIPCPYPCRYPLIPVLIPPFFTANAVASTASSFHCRRYRMGTAHPPLYPWLSPQLNRDDLSSGAGTYVISTPERTITEADDEVSAARTSVRCFQA